MMKGNSYSAIAIRFTGVTKEYTIHHQKLTLAKKFIRRKDEKFLALNNISLEIRKGERIGIIGPNGSGKTTLLKIIAGITSQTRGSVITRGKVAALIDLEAGFHPDLTGKENIFLNGMLIGMAKAELQTKLKEIIEFADIGKFIYQPFFTYSAGMKFRLAFAVAVASECEVLLLDELFVSGDINFQHKSLRKIKAIQNSGKKITTVICSHVPAFMWNFADRFYELKSGVLKPKSAKSMLTDIKRENKVWESIYKLVK